MVVEVRYSGQVVTVESRRGTVEARTPAYTVDVESSVVIGGTPYDGPYEVTPTPEEQYLYTSGRRLREDVNVHAIPYLQTGNDAGGYTVSIAS